MTDQYNINGQSGIVGPNAQVTNMNLKQNRGQALSGMDHDKLLQELTLLRETLIKTAKTPEEFTDLAIVSAAERELAEGHLDKAAEVLSKLGKRVFNAAEQIGLSIAKKIIESSLVPYSPNLEQKDKKFKAHFSPKQAARSTRG